MCDYGLFANFVKICALRNKPAIRYTLFRIFNDNHTGILHEC